MKTTATTVSTTNILSFIPGTLSSHSICSNKLFFVLRRPTPRLSEPTNRSLFSIIVGLIKSRTHEGTVVMRDTSLVCVIISLGMTSMRHQSAKSDTSNQLDLRLPLRELFFEFSECGLNWMGSIICPFPRNSFISLLLSTSAISRFLFIRPKPKPLHSIHCYFRFNIIIAIHRPPFFI